MRPMRVTIGLFITMVFLVVGCSSDDDPVAVTDGDADTTTSEPADDASTDEPAEPTATATTEPAAEPTEVDEDPTPEPEPLTTRELLFDRGIGRIELADAESGPHPLLSWSPVDGADTYWLAVRDSAGLAYWAWTGSTTEVRVGGGDRAEENQTAVVYEPMEWSVSAFDADGTLIAISEAAAVTP